MLASVTEQEKRRWLEDFKPTLERAFYLRFNLYPAGIEALERINDLLHEVPEIVISGEFSRGASSIFSSTLATTSRTLAWR